MNKKHAEELWSSLRENLLEVDRIITKIIEEKAWEPLGYKSFFECWKAKMQNVRMADALTESKIIYQMLEEGMEDVDIAVVMKGVGGSKIKTHRKNKGMGVPVEFGNTIVREHERTVPYAPWHTVHVELSPREFQQLRRIATQEGTTAAELLADSARQIIARDKQRRVVKRSKSAA